MFSNFPRFLICPADLRSVQTFPTILGLLTVDQLCGRPSGAWNQPNLERTIVGYQHVEIHVVALARKESLHIFNWEMDDDP